MKEYSNYSSSTFILSYEVKDGNIVAKLANKEKYIVPYTEENERKILERMEQQVAAADIKQEKHHFKESLRINLTILIVFYIIALGIFACLHQLPSIPTIIISCAMGIGYDIASIALKYKSEVNDLEKMKQFLSEQEDLNKGIKENAKSKNLVLGINNKAKQEIEERIKANKEPFDVNNVEKISLKELRKLKANLLRIKSFGLEEEVIMGKGFSDYQVKENDKVEEPGPTLIK